jgi:sigma-E factor negative regulatory protein RseC
MATEEGVVTRIESAATAWVKTTRSGACKSCSARSSCHSLGGGEETEVEAINRAGAQTGQKVVLSFDTSPLLKATFLLYMFPILTMMAGAFIGQQLAEDFRLDPSFLSAVFGFLCFGLTFVFVRAKGNKLAKRDEYRPKIIRVIGQSIIENNTPVPEELQNLKLD